MFTTNRHLSMSSVVHRKLLSVARLPRWDISYTWKHLRLVSKGCWAHLDSTAYPLGGMCFDTNSSAFRPIAKKLPWSRRNSQRARFALKNRITHSRAGVCSLSQPSRTAGQTMDVLIQTRLNLECAKFRNVFRHMLPTVKDRTGISLSVLQAFHGTTFSLNSPPQTVCAFHTCA